jgi:hypothetical protein
MVSRKHFLPGDIVLRQDLYSHVRFNNRYTIKILSHRLNDISILSDSKIHDIIDVIEICPTGGFLSV